MFQYIIRKIFYGFLVLFGVVTIIFVLFNIKPGDPSLMLGGQNATDEVIENIRKDKGWTPNPLIFTEILHKIYES